MKPYRHPKTQQEKRFASDPEYGEYARAKRRADNLPSVYDDIENKTYSRQAKRLRKFLISKVGQSWDSIYSKISKDHPEWKEMTTWMVYKEERRVYWRGQLCVKDGILRVKKRKRYE